MKINNKAMNDLSKEEMQERINELELQLEEKIKHSKEWCKQAMKAGEQRAELSRKLHKADQQAKKEAIELLEFINDPVNEFVLHNGRWIQACGNSTSWSNEQLYNLYIQSKQKRDE
jgi:hypothetical protein